MNLIRWCSSIRDPEEECIMFLSLVGVEEAALNHQRTVFDASHEDLMLDLCDTLGGGAWMFLPINLEPMLLVPGQLFSSYTDFDDHLQTCLLLAASS